MEAQLGYAIFIIFCMACMRFSAGSWLGTVPEDGNVRFELGALYLITGSITLFVFHALLSGDPDWVFHSMELALTVSLIKVGTILSNEAYRKIHPLLD